MIPWGDSQHTQNLQINKVIIESEKCVFYFMKKLNKLFGQPKTYKGGPMRLSADFSKETLQAGRDWQEVFKVMNVRAYNQDYSTQQSCHLEWKGR